MRLFDILFLTQQCVWGFVRDTQQEVMILFSQKVVHHQRLSQLETPSAVDRPDNRRPQTLKYPSPASHVIRLHCGLTSSSEERRSQTSQTLRGRFVFDLKLFSCVHPTSLDRVWCMTTVRDEKSWWSDLHSVLYLMFVCLDS